MSRLLLYYTEHCHLCDEAENLLQTTGLGDDYRKVEIDDDPELLRRYEIHIPVLKRVDNETELYWPFGQAELVNFIAGE
jgi:glutaredoxin-related protein